MKHLRILSYVDEVARTGSIRKAAERLNVTASAVNRRIADLEEELGAPLFEKRGGWNAAQLQLLLVDPLLLLDEPLQCVAQGRRIGQIRGYFRERQIGRAHV